MTPDRDRLNRALSAVRVNHGLEQDRTWREYLAAKLERLKDQVLDAENSQRRDELAAQAKIIRDVLKESVPTTSPAEAARKVSLSPNVSGHRL